MKQELLKGLTEEQIAKVKACKSQEEMLALAKEEGIELTDEQLEAVSGGGCSNTLKCVTCGSTNLKFEYTRVGPVFKDTYYTCNDCHQQFYRRGSNK